MQPPLREEVVSYLEKVFRGSGIRIDVFGNPEGIMDVETGTGIPEFHS